MTKEEKESITKLIGEFDKSLQDQAKTWENVSTRDAMGTLKRAMRVLGQEQPSRKDMTDLANEYANILRYEQMSIDYDQIRSQFSNKFREVYYITVEQPKEEQK